MWWSDQRADLLRKKLSMHVMSVFRSLGLASKSCGRRRPALPQSYYVASCGEGWNFPPCLDFDDYHSMPRRCHTSHTPTSCKLHLTEESTGCEKCGNERER